MIKKENPAKVIFDLNNLTRIDVDGVDAIKNCQSKFKGQIFFEFVRDWDLSPDGFKPNNVNVNKQIKMTKWYPKGTTADKMGRQTKIEIYSKTTDDDDNYKRFDQDGHA